MAMEYTYIRRETLHCADERHVAGLPLAGAHLTSSQPQLRLPVPLDGLGACPAMSIHQYHTHAFPPRTISTRILCFEPLGGRRCERHATLRQHSLAWLSKGMKDIYMHEPQ